MAAPVISATSSYLGFKRNEPFNFQPAASGGALAWSIETPPPGLTIDTPTAYAATGVEATDVVTGSGSSYANGDKVYFSSITGGAGLTANTIYFVRDVSGATFKLAATLAGPAIDFTTDISAGIISKVSTGLISAATGIEVQGPYVFNVAASNGDGTGTKEFCIHISSVNYAASTADTAIDLAFDMVSGLIALGRTISGGSTAAQQSADAIAYIKSGDIRIFALRCFKEGVQVDPNFTALKMVFKEFAPEKVLVAADSMEKVGAGESAVFRLAVSITRSGVKGAISNNEGDTESAFNALVELEWRAATTHGGNPLDLVGSSQTFVIRCSGDLASTD